MTDIPLAEYAKGKTQAEVARQIGVNQSALSQMLRSGRIIRIRTDLNGAVIGAYEVREIGNKAAA